MGNSAPPKALPPIEMVSIGIIARNEEKSLGNLLADIAVQDFPHERIEIILVDSASTDKTKALMQEFAEINREDNLGFAEINILDNPKVTIPCGWNVALKAFKGDVFLRVDAHARLPFDFVSANVAVLEEGEYVCGGPRPTVANPDTPWTQTLLFAEESAFGSSVADYRGNSEKQYVSAVFLPAFRREVVEKVGLYDERLLRTEDNDYCYRIRLAGYRIRFDYRIRSRQIARSTFARMLTQKYGNGYWVGRTLFIQPKCLHVYHFAPVAFVIGAVSVLLVGAFATWQPFRVCGIAYALICGALTVMALVQSSKRYVQMLALPVVFAGIHVSYGLGTLCGIASGLKDALAGATKKSSDCEQKLQPIDLSPSELRQMQLKSLEMFRYLEGFCNEHGLLVYFCGGCCIGALRHKGFIPWDDDVDVMMPREDYEKLAELWPQFADIEKYSYLRPNATLVTGDLMAKICDNTTTLITVYQQGKDMPQGLTLDIIPLDGCPSSRMARRIQKAWALVFSLYCSQTVPTKHGGIMALGSKALLALVPGKKARYHIWRHAERQMTKYRIDDCEKITELCSGPGYMQNEYPKECFTSAVQAEFEGDMAPIPVGYDRYLRMAFGDYMELPPEEKRVPQHSVVVLDLETPYSQYFAESQGEAL